MVVHAELLAVLLRVQDPAVVVLLRVVHVEMKLEVPAADAVRLVDIFWHSC